MATRSPVIPRTLPLLTALTSGVLIALALQVALAERGLQIADIWRDISTGERTRAAIVWWIIAGVTLVAGAVIARPLALYKPPWVRLRTQRWIAGLLVVALLAHIAHEAALPEGVSPVVYLLATAAAMCLGALMAVFGAMFGMRA